MASPIFRACFEGDLDAVRLVLASDALQANAARSDGVRPLHVAAVRRNVELVELLLSFGGDRDAVHPPSGATAVGLCAQENCVPALEAILGPGPRPAARLDARDARGRSPLFVAAKLGNHEALALLCNRGANPETVDGAGVSALAAATERGHLECVRVLLRHGANPNGLTKGPSPLDLAIACRHVAVAVALVEAGARVDEALPAKELYPSKERKEEEEDEKKKKKKKKTKAGGKSGDRTPPQPLPTDAVDEAERVWRCAFIALQRSFDAHVRDAAQFK